MHTDSAQERFWGGWLACMVASQVVLAVLVLYANGTIDFGYRVFAVVLMLTSLAIFALAWREWRAQSLRPTGLQVLCLWSLAALMTLGLCAGAGLLPLLSLDIIAGWWLVSLAALAATRRLLHGLFTWARRAGDARALVLGSRVEATRLIARLAEEGVTPLGILGPQADYRDTSLAPLWRGEESDLRAALVRYDVKNVYLAMPLTRFDDVHHLYADIANRYANVYWAADLDALAPLAPALATRNGLALVGFNLSPRIKNAVTITVKDMLERVLAALAIVLLLPVLAAIAVAVKLSSPGPVIFRQARHGCDGRIIEIWKFRSMVQHREHGVTQARREDPRVTRVGRFIRRTSLDELPQLFNVVQGRLALIGPRPHAVAHNSFYEEQIALYNVRHSLKPGITGLAQVSGCRGETDRVEKMKQRVDYDLHYIRHWSLWMDLKILVKTPFTLFAKDIY